MPDGKIIKFTGEQPPVKVKERDHFIHECRHYPATVDRKLRTVVCDQCGVDLDPVEVLLDMAYGYRAQDYKLKEMERYEAKNAERNERARQRRARKGSADA